MSDLVVTARTTPHRYAERMRDRALLDQVVDEALYCHLTFVTDDGPRVLPTLHVRIGDTLYLHGSTGSGPMLAGRDGMDVCIAVTLIDGLAFARSQFHHSVNYRSVVVHGRATPVTDAGTKRAVLAALVDQIATGRGTDSRPPTDRELAATAVLAVPLAEASVKSRTDGVKDDDADLDLPHWAGVLPLRLTAGAPEPDDASRPLPGYLLDWRRGPRPPRSPWLEPATMTGRLVRLEALSLAHVDDLLEAGRDPEVWRWLGTDQPTDRDGMARHLAGAIRAGNDGQRISWAQVDLSTGRAVGMTSFYDIVPEHRRVEIGYTWLGRPWWRGGINTEAKLLLMTRAFEELGARRVSWRTDLGNERSQRAIERLGASRDGVLRNHMIRTDGSMRDSVVYSVTDREWPAVRDRLRDRLTRPAGG
ncbi:MAG: bifunctional pyridoxamine 5'-phosphate oxidase family protein/GNAT family N-acetyltransferase [Actinocatenispora sp.]